MKVTIQARMKGKLIFLLKCIFKTLLGKVWTKVFYLASEPLVSVVKETGLEHGDMSVRLQFLLFFAFHLLKDKFRYFQAYHNSACTSHAQYVERVMSQSSLLSTTVVK